MDRAGLVRITGRLKDMVIRGGENIYPREIEDVLHGLEPVAAAAVMGVPDERYGEELLACVVLRPGVAPPTDEAFRAMCEGRLARYKIPRYWRIVDALPVTGSGKVQKFKLRERFVRDARPTTSA